MDAALLLTDAYLKKCTANYLLFLQRIKVISTLKYFPKFTEHFMYVVFSVTTIDKCP